MAHAAYALVLRKEEAAARIGEEVGTVTSEALLQPDGRVWEEGVTVRPEQEPQMRKALHARAHEEDLAPRGRRDGRDQRGSVACLGREVHVAIRGGVVGVVAHADAIEHRLAKGILTDGRWDRVRDDCNRRRCLAGGYCCESDEEQRRHMPSGWSARARCSPKSAFSGMSAQIEQEISPPF